MIVGLRAGDPRRVGPYALLGRLGCGGMGSVFLGRPADGSLAAVKVIRADLAGDPGFRARFSQEVTAAGKVSGQFTAALADADTTGPVPWLATSYVPGPSLAELVRLHGALPLSSVLVLGAGLAGALGAIHEADLVHRDLKPSNVLVAADGPRVIDFGISRAAGAASLTMAGMVMGSPGFMSPEQAQGGPVGPASDVFSLGTLLAFAVTGQGPFGAGSMAALLYRVVYGQPSTEDLPRQLRPLVVRCLAKDPGDRPTAAELRAELGAASPAVDWLPAPVARTLSRFAAPEDTLAEAVRAEAALAGAARAEAAPVDAAPADAAPAHAAPVHAAAARPGWDPPASHPCDAVDTPVWLPMTGSQLPVPADSGPASAAPGSAVPGGAVPAGAGLAGQLAAVGSRSAMAGLLRPLAAMRLAGMGGADPETGMELPVAGGQLAGPGHQLAGPGHQLPVPGHQFPGPGHQFPGPGHQFPGPGDQAVGTEEDPTVTAARPRPLRNVPGPPAAAVAPPRHPGRRRSRRWAAAGAVTGAAGVLLGVMLSGVLQPAARPAAHPDKAAARLPGPAAVAQARGPHRTAAHQHRHRAGAGAGVGSGVTMAVASSSSPSPGGGQPAAGQPGAPSNAASPTPSTAPSSPNSHRARTYTQAVPGGQEWTGTGITVRAGDQLTITASGEIYIGATSAGESPAGTPSCTPAASYPAQSAQFPAPSLTCWSLIARIGTGTPFEVGSSAQLTAAASGELYLGINGDSFTGNSGAWSATITARSR